MNQAPLARTEAGRGRIALGALGSGLLVTALMLAACSGTSNPTAPVIVAAGERQAVTISAPATAAPPVTTQPSAPTPFATPGACPPVTAWPSSIHNIYAGGSQVSEPVEGGFVLIDSTPQFGGRACNSESDGCGGRHCEDPRGGEWTLLDGESRAVEHEAGYQFKIGPLVAGYHRWRVCPRADAHDAEGVPLEIGPSPCSEGYFTVR